MRQSDAMALLQHIHQNLGVFRGFTKSTYTQIPMQKETQFDGD
jgi:hypothetical protein